MHVRSSGLRCRAGTEARIDASTSRKSLAYCVWLLGANARLGIELAQGVCVRVSTDVDEATLRCALRVLREIA